MKTHMALAVLILALPTQAKTIEIEWNAGRRVADAMEVVTLPNGEVGTRLVSRNQVTAHQFWVDSVYHKRDSLLVYDEQDGATQYARTMPRKPLLTTQHNEHPNTRCTNLPNLNIPECRSSSTYVPDTGRIRAGNDSSLRR